MKRYLRILLLGALLAAAGSARAQLHESISVEGDYVPDIIRLGRVNMLPEAERFTLDATPLPFEREGVATPFRPTLLTMPATVWQGARVARRNRGYLEAALGSWLDADLSAGYRFIDSDASQAGAWLQYNSTSLFRVRTDEMPDPSMRRLYDGTLGLYGSHTFAGAGTLSAQAAWRGAWYNYYSLPQPKLPSQTLNRADARISWDSRDNNPDALPQLTYSLAAGLRHTGFRTLPAPDAAAGTAPLRGQRETMADIDAAIDMPWDGGSHIGADARLDMLFYSNSKTTPEALCADNYANFRITPYYRFSRGLLNVRVGADIEFTSGAGTPSSRFPLFHIAPDVRLDWQKDIFGLSLALLGGNTLSTLAASADRSLYNAPFLATTRPVYRPLDATLGFSFGPFSGFEAGVSAAYRITRRAPCTGWYAAWLSGGAEAIPGLTLPEGFTPLYCLDTDGLSASGWRLALDASYSYGRLLTVSAAAAWMPRNGENGWLGDDDRARFTLSASATLRPLDALSITLGYDLRAGREFFTRATRSDQLPGVAVGGNLLTSRSVGLSLPAISLLSLRADYALTRRFSIFASADNLLCRRHIIMPALPSERLTLAAGLSLLF